MMFTTSNDNIGNENLEIGHVRDGGYESIEINRF